jgi:hypothetical protein
MNSNGVCTFCGKTFSKTAMKNHLDSCEQMKASSETAEKLKSKKARLLHLVVEGRYSPEYWIHVEAREDATLKDLDDFLRQIWLECCGHLSVFTIEGEKYLCEVIEPPIFDFEHEKGMDAKIGDVLKPGMSFAHEYDFGTTTELKLRVASERKGERGSKRVRLMARNTPPPITCSVCGKTATQVCTQCIYDGTGWLCDECASNHKCGEEMLLPVVNSPRVGMCGYTGE